MKKIWFLILISVLVSLAVSTITFAQLRDMDQPRVFRDEIVKVGEPFPGGDMVTLCHIPPGNPENAQTIDVDQAAVAAHLAHGDLLGACPYECDGVPSPVPQTGQTECWGDSAPPNLVDCAGTGQDGENQNGVSVDPRFTDNLDGTVTDNLTGLIWLTNANCIGLKNWTTALSDADGLASGACGLSDGSMAGDWRLPNIKELQSLIDFGEGSPALPAGHPFSGVQLERYWSSSSFVLSQNAAWTMNFFFGLDGIQGKSAVNVFVWPVRGGQ